MRLMWLAEPPHDLKLTVPFDFPEPAFAFRFGDSGLEIVADLDQALALGGVWPEQCATDAGM
jgi:hypothetical protein